MTIALVYDFRDDIMSDRTSDLSVDSYYQLHEKILKYSYPSAATAGRVFPSIR